VRLDCDRPGPAMNKQTCLAHTPKHKGEKRVTVMRLGTVLSSFVTWLAVENVSIINRHDFV
jgi:hypothetical protein